MKSFFNFIRDMFASRPPAGARMRHATVLHDDATTQIVGIEWVLPCGKVTRTIQTTSLPLR